MKKYKLTSSFLAFLLTASLAVSPGNASASNLFKNYGFETVRANGAITDWIPYGDTWGNHVSSADEGYNSPACVKIVSDNTVDNPWIAQPVNVTGEAEYTVSVYLKTAVNMTGTPEFKFEFYNESTDLGSDRTVTLPKTGGVWSRVTAKFTPPRDCTRTVVYLRLRGIGEIYWDFAECTMTKEPPLIYFSTDNFIYYSDWTEGKASIAPNINYPPPQGCTLEVALKNQTGEVVESQSMNLGAGAEFTFSLSGLDKKMPYAVEYVCKNALGNEVDQGSITVYRYDRPGRLSEDGIYIKDGTPFFPIIGYHVDSMDYSRCMEAGINVVQFFIGSNINESAITSRLNELQSYGLMAFVALYDTDSLSDQLKIIEFTRNHEATFGYMLMDEPTLIGGDFEKLAALYKAVRDMAPEHPAYMVEGPAAAANYAKVGRCTDILAVDPYPPDSGAMATYVSSHVSLAKAAVYNKKPVYCINKIATEQWSPSPDDIRNMHYQALFEGAEGLGYYDVRDFYGYIEPGVLYEHMWERDSYPGVVGFGEKEADIAFEAFVLGNMECVSENQSGNVWWKCYRDDADIYCVAINQTAAAQNTTMSEITAAESSKVKVINGLDFEDIITDGTLTVTIPPRGVAVFSVTPQLIKNGSFNSGMAGWNYVGNPTVENGALRITDGSYGYQILNWRQGRKYRIKLDFMTPDGARPLVKPEGSGLEQYEGPVPANNVWTTYEIIMTAPQSCPVAVLFRGAEGKTAYYDNIEIREMPGDTELRLYQGNKETDGLFEGIVTAEYSYAGPGDNACLIIVLYETINETKVIRDMSVKKGAFSSADFTVPREHSAYTAEAFSWDSVKGMIPLCSKSVSK